MSWMNNLHSANWNQAGWIFLFSYILGCFTAGYYLVRWTAGKDIRHVGSGSVGARNVARELGKPGFFLTVLFDFSKGALAVWTAQHFSTDDRVVAIAMLGAVVGHIWPAQLRFHGGKGVATSLGALAVFDFQLAATFAVVFVCLAALMRKTILPALCAFAILPVAGGWLGQDPVQVVELSILAGLITFAHRKNCIEEFSHFAARRALHSKSGPPQL